jgi:hypothetical protein
MSSGCMTAARRWQESGSAVKRFAGGVLERITKLIWPKSDAGGPGPQGPSQSP